MIWIGANISTCYIPACWRWWGGGWGIFDAPSFCSSLCPAILPFEAASFPKHNFLLWNFIFDMGYPFAIVGKPNGFHGYVFFITYDF